MDLNALSFDWNYARTFLFVAKEGSLSAAARKLNSTQPTVGRQISALEEELNLVLFDRVVGGIKLTDSGLALLDHVEDMYGSARQIAMTAAGHEQEAEGEVVLAVTEMDGHYLAPHIVKRLAETAPKVRLKIRVSNQLSNLGQREADIAIRYKRPEQPDLIVKKLFSETIRLYGHHSYLETLSADDEIPCEELKIIGVEDYPRMIQYLNQRGWRLTEENFFVLTDNQASQVEMMRLGLGLGFLPDHIAGSYPMLKPAFPQLQSPIELDAWVVCHRELHTSKRMREVFNVIVECVQELSPNS